VVALLQEICTAPPDEVEVLVARIKRNELDKFMPLIAEAFPGPTWFDRRRPHRRLPGAREVSGLATALCTIGELSVPYLAWLLESEDPDVRYFAALVCTEVVDSQLLRPLWQVALGADAPARAAATEGLRAHRHLPEMNEVVTSMRKLAIDPRTRQVWRLRAIEALGRLGEKAAAADLIEVLGDKNRQMARAAHDALRELTCHDLGQLRMPWRRWLRNAGGLHRVQWLLAALEDRRPDLRQLALRELERLSGDSLGLAEDAPAERYLEAKQHYARWWTERTR